MRIADVPREALTEEEISLPGVTLNTYVVMRCNRWGVYVRWLQDQGLNQIRPKRVRSWWGPLVLDRNVPHPWRDTREDCPGVDPLEARETDIAIRRLAEQLSDVLIVEHVIDRVPRHGRWHVVTQQEKAEMLAISRTTYWRRCGEAYGLLLGHMNDVAAGF